MLRKTTRNLSQENRFSGRECLFNISRSILILVYKIYTEAITMSIFLWTCLNNYKNTTFRYWSPFWRTACSPSRPSPYHTSKPMSIVCLFKHDLQFTISVNQILLKWPNTVFWNNVTCCVWYCKNTMGHSAGCDHLSTEEQLNGSCCWQMIHITCLSVVNISHRDWASRQMALWMLCGIWLINW
jgi:hypothetical protein